MQVKVWVRRLAAIAFFLVFGACDEASKGSPPTGVVFVLIDALRADRLGCYGNPRNTSPNLDAFAKRGTLFLNAIAPAPWTLPTMSTIWTSLHPSVHGATRISDLFQENVRPVTKLDESRVTFAEILQQNGFATAAFVDGTYPRKVFGLAQGFDIFHDADLPGIRLNVEAMLDWLDREKPERFFAYVHTVEVHSPYGPGKLQLPRSREGDADTERINKVLAEEQRRYHEFDFNPGYKGEINGYWTVVKKERRNIEPLPEADQEQLFAVYDRGIAYTDYWMGKMIEGLEKRGLLDSTVVVVTADHGDELLDHDGVEHGETFYEEMIKVPLIMRIPELATGMKIEPQVGLVDLTPSLLDVLGIRSDLFFQGRSFVPLLKGESIEELPVFAEASLHPGHAAVRTNDWKYIESRQAAELYNLKTDPSESRNVCDSKQTICSGWRDQLRKWRAQNAKIAKQLAMPAAPKAEVDEETRERLRALGYQE